MGRTLQKIFEQNGYPVQRVECGKAALQLVEHDEIGIVFLDFRLPDINGIEVLKRMKHVKTSMTIIMMSINGAIQKADEATELGAYDWLQKPIGKESALATLNEILKRINDTNAKGHFQSEVKDKYNLVGASRALQQICNIIDKVASQNTTVLISGESGTGKEMVAYAVHLNSNRADKPFICINCAAVHETLIESELFGHKRGSFTGAYNTKKGKFQLGDKGTLFLDEIGDLSANAQAKLLRTIETGEVEMLGTEEVGKVDVRIICATNKNLNEMVHKGSFREDLLHRINVIRIHIPPLRERPDDILPLAQHFLEMFCDQNEVELKKLTMSAEAALLSHNWQGNVRELRNVIEKITVLVDSHVVNSHHISQFITCPDSVNGLYKAKTFRQAKKCFEKSYITHALWENDWNISKTAAALSLPRSSLYEKIKEYDINKNPGNQTVCQM